MGPETPPLPPRIPGRIVLPPGRLLGAMVIVSIPVLALFGVFGERWESKTVEIENYRVEVRIPSRFRYRETSEITVRFQNLTALPVTAGVSVSPSLLEGFAEVSFLPAEEKAYHILLDNVGAGAEARVRVSVRADRYGTHRGDVRVAAGAVTATVPVSIFIFP